MDLTSWQNTENSKQTDISEKNFQDRIQKIQSKLTLVKIFLMLLENIQS